MCIPNWGDVTESLSCVQEGVLSDMQGIPFSFTAAACRSPLTCTGRVHVGSYHKAAKLLQAPPISVCCFPQESLSRAKHEAGSWVWWHRPRSSKQYVESASDTGERRRQCKSFLKRSLTGLFAVTSGWWKDCSLLHSQVLSEEPELFSAAFHDRAVASKWCDSFTCWLLKEENKQDSDFLPCPLPWGTLSGPTWNHLSPLPTRAEIT